MDQAPGLVGKGATNGLASESARLFCRRYIKCSECFPAACARCDLWGLPIVAHIPDPLPLPCRKQNWTNADRVCLSWTAPRDNMRQTTAAATDRDRSGAPEFETP